MREVATTADEAPILVVDDDPKILQLVRMYLERAPRLVVLDLMLPTLDGSEVLRAARAESDVAVLILSARGSTADRISGIASGADDYLPKPFSPAELVVRVKALLRRAEPRERPGRKLLSLG